MDDELFMNQSMLTCLGNKRKLIKNIQEIIHIDVLPHINKEKINIFDGFTGSCIVSKGLVKYANNLYSNDLELYSYIMAKCFLEEPNEEDKKKVYHHIDQMNKLAINGPFHKSFISQLYSPENTNYIKEGERCIYTRENALIIDTLRDYIDKNVEEKLFHYCITPLLIKASIHTNTCGVFKGFYKNKEGVGQWGGERKNDLKRILKPIKLEYPVWSKNKLTCHVHNKDINELIKDLPNDLDLIYLDPPYNEHPYSSNYFMLNLIIKNKKSEYSSKVTGIPKDWNRSNYNYRNKAIQSMKDLINESIKKTKYILLSYNNEGIIPNDEWDKMFDDLTVKKYEIKYDTFKGSRNLKERSDKVLEIMYLISK